MTDYVDSLGDRSSAAKGDIVERRDDRLADADDLLPSGDPARVPRMTEQAFNATQYSVENRNRGYSIIINNMKFKKKCNLNNRPEPQSLECKDNMYKLLDALNFEKIEDFDDLEAQEMIDLMQKMADAEHKENDCFMCVILSRGAQGYVWGTDDKVSLDDLLKPFKEKTESPLAGKPKLFFIHADPDSPSEEADDGVEAEHVEVRLIPSEADFLMVYNTADGLRFTKALYDVFSANHRDMDILSMMTRVNRQIVRSHEAERDPDDKSHEDYIPCTTSMLTKELIFSEK